MSTKVATHLRRELTLKPNFEVFWTDSKVVLGYIANVSKRFHLFVSNHVQAIHVASEVEQWRYVSTSENPADDASRGQNIEKFVQNKRWFNGPKFLWRPLEMNKSTETFHVDEEDIEKKKEVKCMITNTISINQHCSLQQLFERVSTWYRLKRIIARMLLWRYKDRKIDAELLSKAELAIIRLIRQQQFPIAVTQSTDGDDQTLRKSKSTLSQLNPFIDEERVIRVGGRISCSILDWKVKHPVTVLLIRHFHDKAQHGGRDATLNEIRQRGYMIVNASSNVRNKIFKCVTCRRFRGRLGEQKMANLLSERCLEVALFTYSGVCMLGHFLIKKGRKELKRYVALFICFSSRAIHLERTNMLDTNSFIMALRRFIN